MAAQLDHRIRRINSLLSLSRKSLRWLARQVQAEPATISNILSGKTLTPRDPQVIEEMLSVLEHDASLTFHSRRLNGALILIPVYQSASVSQIHSSLPAIDYEAIPEPEDGSTRYGFRVATDAMSPLLLPGDIAIINPGTSMEGSVMLISNGLSEDLRCLRMFKGNQAYCAFQPDYPPLPTDTWQEKGVCVGMIRHLRGRNRLYVDAQNGFNWEDRGGL